MNYRDYEEDDVNIHFRHRGRSPSPLRPVRAPSPLYRSVRSPYYERERERDIYLDPVVPIHRASSCRRSSPQPAPFQQPIVINNFNEHSDDDLDSRSPPPRHRRGHSRSHSRASFTSSRGSDLALEKLRLEMAEMKIRERADQEADKIRREMLRAELRLSSSRDQREHDDARRALDELRRTHERDDYEAQQMKHDLDELKAKRQRDAYEAEQQRRELEAYRSAHTRDEYLVEKAKADADNLRLEKKRLDEEKKILALNAKTKEDLENEASKKELKEFKAAKAREKEEKRIKEEIEMERLRKEAKAADEKARIKKENEAAIEKYKQEEAEKKAKKKKEEEEREKEYKQRAEDDMRKAGMSESTIKAILNGEKPPAQLQPRGYSPSNELARPTYTRMSRKHLSIETLRSFNLDWEYDTDAEYILIKRWVPEVEQDMLWRHTREIRESRHGHSRSPEPVLLLEKEHRRSSRHRHHDDELQLVIEKKHKRKNSPSPLLTYLAGGSSHRHY